MEKVLRALLSGELGYPLAQIRQLSDDALQNVIETKTWQLTAQSVTAHISTRLSLLVKTWPRLQTYWRETLGSEPPLETLWRAYLPFAQWIAVDKRLREKDFYLVGLQGSIGQGKSVLNAVLQMALPELLLPDEGTAAGASIDDYYLSHADRNTSGFQAQGYNPPGISNRGPAGTHDVAELMKDIERLREGKMVSLPLFDKQTDDRRIQTVLIGQKVGVFVLDGWFLGAGAPERPIDLPLGLKQSVGQALVDYQPLFNQMDALWSFEQPTFDQILANRIQQQKTLNRQGGNPGMTERQMGRFVQYFYQDAWEPGMTSPDPLPERISFRARLDAAYQVVQLDRGARLSNLD